MRDLRLLASLVVVLLAISCQQKRVDEPPRYYVNDQVNLLTPSQRDSLTAEIVELEKNIGSQMVILIIDSLRGVKIEEYSLRLANEWGIGRSAYNDGVLITVAMTDRKTRIEVGTGLELIIKDEIAARILREDMAPQFREGRYFEGLYVTVSKLKALITENQHLIGKTP
ncbi:MAG TPA: TPM domain-containing protein [Chryseosolibacter sp.]|nr:TPM domain-containing protein [Chryseosolibacter sp.]